jgi:surface protein
LLKYKKNSLIEKKENIEYLIKLIDIILISYEKHSYNYFHNININNLANSLKIYNKMNQTLEEQIKSNSNNALDYLNKKLKIKLKEDEKELDLSNTNLESEDFKILSILDLSKIEKINLSSNKLKDMSVLNNLNLSEIKIIDLSNNEIENPEFLKQLSGQAQKLERLYLNNNKIKYREYLKKKFFKYLKEIRLEENPMTAKEICEIYNIINEQKYSNQFTICYSIDKEEFYNENKIRIFGDIFVNNNEQNCYLIINGQKTKLTQFYNYNEEENELKIKLVKTGDIIDLSSMFAHCASLTSLPDISRLDTSKVEDMNSMFLNCKKLAEIDDISKWDVSKVRSMKCMFFNCQSLSSLPDIEKWNLNDPNMNAMFEGCNTNIIPDKFL